MSWRRLGSLLRYLPREAATVQEVLGEEARWGDNEYLLAIVADSLGHLGWMYANVHAKNAPRKPPRPLRRPGDVELASGVTLTMNLTERTTITTTALSLDELDAAVAHQTGTPQGIMVEV